MAEITVAADETAATRLVAFGQSILGTQSTSGSGSLGPFTASYSASASFSGGTVDLIAPDIIRNTNGTLNYALNFTFSLDLNQILPNFCLPRVCINIPFIGRVCTPRICISWPTISVPVSHSGTILFTADFRLNTRLSGSDWIVEIIVVGVPFLQLGPVAVAILSAIGIALAAVVVGIPFIGPFLAGAVIAITALIGIAGLTGFLGTILTPFVSGLTFQLYRQPRLFVVIPAAPPDAAVDILIDSLTASVVSSDEDELVLEADISP